MREGQCFTFFPHSKQLKVKAWWLREVLQSVQSVKIHLDHGYRLPYEWELPALLPHCCRLMMDHVPIRHRSWRLEVDPVPHQSRTEPWMAPACIFTFLYFYTFCFFFIGICKDSLGLLQKTVLLNITQMTTLVILQIPFRKKYKHFLNTGHQVTRFTFEWFGVILNLWSRLLKCECPNRRKSAALVNLHFHPASSTHTRFCRLIK